jgi:hypothetical protein
MGSVLEVGRKKCKEEKKKRMADSGEQIVGGEESKAVVSNSF